MLPQVLTPPRQPESAGVGVVAGAFGCERERVKEKWETRDEQNCAACSKSPFCMSRICCSCTTTLCQTREYAESN